MPTKQQTKKIIKNPKILVLSIVSIFIFFILLSSVVELWKKHRAINRHIKDLKTEEAELMQKKDSVTSMNENISTDEGKERIFRDTYRLIKPGEGIIVITNNEKIDATEAKKPAIRRFWDAILRGLGL